MTPPTRAAGATTGERPPAWLVLGLLAAIALGIWLRCEGLDRRPLWYDEVATALHLAGRTEAELRRTYDGSARNTGELVHAFQHPDDGASLQRAAAAVRAVAADEPQSGPGYFAAAAVALRGRDASAATLRWPSAVASIVALTLLGALAARLQPSRAVALATVALAALSPLQIRYAQEARGYALWSALLLAAMLALPSARACRPAARWLAFALLLAAACLVHAFTLLVVPALLLLASDAGAEEGAARTRVARAAGGVALAVALWAPWLVVVLASRATTARTTAWATEPVGIGALARAWAGVATSVLYRPGGPGGLLDGAPATLSAAGWLLLGAGALLVSAYALVDCARRAPAPMRRFVPALALIPFVVLALTDLLWGGRRSTVDRYLLPSWLALELAIGFALASPGPHRAARRAVLIAILALGAATALRSRPLDAWWNTDPAGFATWRTVAREVARNPQVVVLTDAEPLAVLELARRLPPATRLRLGSDVAAVPADEWTRVLLVRPSAALLDHAAAALPPGRMLVADADGRPVWTTAERGR